MEVEKRKIELEKKDSEIVYSNAIKAGRRIYYLDVKKSRNEDLYLAITESKKKSNGNDENSPVSFEKHKFSYTRKILKNLLKDLKMLSDLSNANKANRFREKNTTRR